MRTYIVNTECAIEHNGKFLIIKRPEGKHAGGLLSLPGGKFEEKDAVDNESDALKNTILREVKEEVNLDLIDPVHYITSSYFEDSLTGTGVVDNVFYCKLNKTVVNVVPKEDEVPEYYWLSYADLVVKENCPVWLILQLDTILHFKNELGNN